MEHLIVVAGVLAAATFATGVLLPVLARRDTSEAGREASDRALADELFVGAR